MSCWRAVLKKSTKELNTQENTSTGVCFLIKLLINLKLYLKRDQGTDAFLWILGFFSEWLFCFFITLQYLRKYINPCQLKFSFSYPWSVYNSWPFYTLDLSILPYLPILPEFSILPDLSILLELSIPTDLFLLPDLSILPGLSVIPDLSIPPDFLYPRPFCTSWPFYTPWPFFTPTPFYTFLKTSMLSLVLMMYRMGALA